jgi:peroxiredoxin Q/BCP
MKDALVKEGITVVGVSGDNPEGLKLFQRANNINFDLLADPDGKVAKKFGVPMRDGGSITRTVDGEEHTLIRGVTSMRWTFVIDKAGKVIYKNSKVNAEEDAGQVLAVVNDSKKSE